MVKGQNVVLVVVSSVTVNTPVTVRISKHELSEQEVIVTVVVPNSVVAESGISELVSPVRTSSNVVAGPSNDRENTTSSIFEL